MVDLKYCNKCGRIHNLPIQDCKETKGECQLCLRYIGRLNQTTLSLKGDEVSKKFGSFTVKSRKPFLAGIQPQAIHPDLPYKFMAKDLVIFFPSMKGRRSLIISNPEKGEEIQIFIE